MQRSLLAELWRFLAHKSAHRVAAARRGAMAALVASMEAHPRDAAALRAGFGCLCVLGADKACGLTYVRTYGPAYPRTHVHTHLRAYALTHLRTCAKASGARPQLALLTARLRDLLGSAESVAAEITSRLEVAAQLGLWGGTAEGKRSQQLPAAEAAVLVAALNAAEVPGAVALPPGYAAKAEAATQQAGSVHYMTRRVHGVCAR